MSVDAGRTPSRDGRLRDRVALVVGAGSGIGRATAAAYAREGARLAVADIRADTAHDVARELAAQGAVVEAYGVDVTEEESVQRLVDAVVSRFGRIDTLFNSFGGSLPEDAPCTELDLSVWDKTLALDLRGIMLMGRHVLPVMISSGGGTLVNMSSGASLLGSGRAHAYASAKGAVNSLTRAMAGAHARDNIRVNAICAGRINTERVKEAYGVPGAAGPHPDHFDVDQTAKRYPFWIGEPEDIAAIAVFLACADSRMITGSLIEANGGRTAY